MGYLVERNGRLYAVVYDGIDPLTGRERRCWRAGGTDRAEAELILARLEAEQRRLRTIESSARGLTVGAFLCNSWLPAKKLELRPTTFSRYEWMIDHYVLPSLGSMLLRRLRADHLEALYTDLVTGDPASRRKPLAPKTVHNLHTMLRAALKMAVRRRLLTVNVADAAVAPRYRSVTPPMRSWTAAQLAAFLDAATDREIFPAFRVSAFTGMRRGEVLGLRWGAVDLARKRLTVTANVQLLDGHITIQAPKTRTSRRTLDIDTTTVDILSAWRETQRQHHRRVGDDDWVFTGARRGAPFHPDLFSQAFDRIVARLDVPRIRLHDLRHTHATLLLKDGVPLKVVSERLGHSSPAFTMATCQHVLPGMGAHAAAQFAELIDRKAADTSRSEITEDGPESA